MSRWWPTDEEYAARFPPPAVDLSSTWDRINRITDRILSSPSMARRIFTQPLRYAEYSWEDEYGPYWRGELERQREYNRRAEWMEASLGL